MARTRRIKKTAAGAAYYHLMSRTNDRKFLFDRGNVKTQLVDALKRAAAFSGVEIDAYAAMDNHFHVVCKVVRPEEPVPEDELIRRVAALKGARAAEELSSHWKELRGRPRNLTQPTACGACGRNRELRTGAWHVKEWYNTAHGREAAATECERDRPGWTVGPR